MALNDKSHLRNWVAKMFRENHWDVQKNVYPDSSNFKTDLVVEKGRFRIGIKCSWLLHNDSYSKLAKDFRSVEEMRWKEFDGQVIELWGILPHGPKEQPSIERFREFFNAFGIATVYLNKGTPRIDFAYSDSEKKVPIEEGTRYIPKYERICQSVQKKAANSFHFPY